MPKINTKARTGNCVRLFVFLNIHMVCAQDNWTDTYYIYYCGELLVQRLLINSNYVISNK